MDRPTFLVTNDDGIRAAFLRHLVAALLHTGDVYVVAPARQQSWTGKAMRRHRDVAVSSEESFPCPAWMVDGTPADCVNLGIGHLLRRRPDLVISGINVGLNAGLPLILNSGTVAAAIEGALLGCTAIALSQYLPADEYRRIEANPTAPDPATLDTVSASASIAAEIARELGSGQNPRNEVHNINFPFPTRPDTRSRRTVPGRLNLGSLYRETSPDRFRFHFQLPEEDEQDLLTDLACLRRGEISHGVLDFGRLGCTGI